jgi:hypothetical protein
VVVFLERGTSLTAGPLRWQNRGLGFRAPTSKATMPTVHQTGGWVSGHPPRRRRCRRSTRQGAGFPGTHLEGDDADGPPVHGLVVARAHDDLGREVLGGPAQGVRLLPRVDHLAPPMPQRGGTRARRMSQRAGAQQKHVRQGRRRRRRESGEGANFN